MADDKEKETKKVDDAAAKEKAEAKAKAKAAGKRKKEDTKKAGFAANIEEGLKEQPARLKLRYRKEIVPALMKELGFKNPNQVPKLMKIVINMGLGEALANNKIMESAVDQLQAITGQKPIVTRSRKAIANFKLRENQAIGATAVTLRSPTACTSFSIASSTSRSRACADFKGVPTKAFDGRGNYRDGRSRADHLSRDQLRPDREGEGLEHQLRHQRRHR